MERPRVHGACVVAALFILIIVGGCASAPPTSTKAAAASEPTSRSAAGPDHYAVAALRSLLTDGNPAQALALMQRASASARDRADLAWLHLRLCREVSGCDSAPLEARLRQLDPANGVAWLSVLSRAQQQRDVRVEGEILEAMSRAQHFDLYWTTLVWRLTTALQASTPPRPDAVQPLTQALNDVVGWLSALALPPFNPLAAACPGDQPARRTSCERIAAALRNSDTTLVEGLGLGLAQKLAPPDSIAARDVEARIRSLGYQSQRAGVIIQAQIERDKFTAQVLELMQKLPHEQDVSIAVLRWAGEALHPR